MRACSKLEPFEVWENSLSRMVREAAAIVVLMVLNMKRAKEREMTEHWRITRASNIRLRGKVSQKSLCVGEV